MTDKKPEIGAIEWRDLTVDDATSVKDFYKQVVGWESSDVSMGDDENGKYEDYCMNLPGSGETVAGVCHAKGCNAGIPPQWLMYVRVANVAESIAHCQTLGGKVMYGPKEMGKDEFCVIEDPAGAVLGLMSEK